MRAIDTNIVVRYLTGDDPVQSPQARALVAGHAVFVPVTVVLETAWVLRAAYGFGAGEVAMALRAFGGEPTVTVEDAARVEEALRLADAGMDLADALHLVRAAGCADVVTFDRAFIAQGAPRVVAP